MEEKLNAAYKIKKIIMEEIKKNFLTVIKIKCLQTKKKDKRPACTTRKDLQCRKLKDLQPKKDKILTLEERDMK
jgi:hypothetical protein